MCRVFLCYEDGKRYELSPVPEHIFRDEYEYYGCSDVGYRKFLREHNWHDISDFDLSDPYNEYFWVEVDYE